MISVDKFLLICIILAAATALTASTAKCENSTKAVNNYEDGTKVDVYASKVVSLFEGHDTLNYYQLPLCHPKMTEPKILTSGRILGSYLAMSNLSLYEVHFKEDVENRELCNLTLNAADIVKLQDVIEDFYYFELTIDDMSVWVHVGYLDESGILPHKHEIFLFTHVTFDIGYNSSQIVSVYKSPQKLATNLNMTESPLNVSITYSVKWHPTNMECADHTKLIRDNKASGQWLTRFLVALFAVIVGICLMYAAFLAVCVRIDLRRYNRLDEEAGKEDHLPFKVIRGDLFRCPSHPSLFCAVLGAGTQFLVIVTCLFIAALLGLFNVHRHGALDIELILFYGLSSFISGFTWANMYQKMGGKRWLLTLNLTSALFIVPCVLILPNAVTSLINSTEAVICRTVCLRLVVWTCAGYQLMTYGVLLGRSRGGTPFATSTSTKPVNQKFNGSLTYSFLLLHCISAGMVQRTVVDLYDFDFPVKMLVLQEGVDLYSILCLFCTYLLACTAISVTITYWQLSAKDHRWWWRSVNGASSSGLSLLVYGFYYGFNNYNILQMRQFAEFIAYVFMLSYISSLMFAAVSFFVSLRFVRYIHDKVKDG